MNYIAMPQQPFLALIDDDAHSARLAPRMLLAHGAPSVHWIDAAAAGTTVIGDILKDRDASLPGLIIVDLKASSAATRDLVAELRKMERGGELLIAAMAPSLDREVRDELLDAGANAVFQRQAELDAYRREAASIGVSGCEISA